MYKWQRIWVIETNSLPRSVDIENLPDSTNQSYKVTCLGFVKISFVDWWIVRAATLVSSKIRSASLTFCLSRLDGQHDL